MKAIRFLAAGLVVIAVAILIGNPTPTRPTPAAIAACAGFRASTAGLALIPVLDLDRPNARELRDAMRLEAERARDRVDEANVECDP